MTNKASLSAALMLAFTLAGCSVFKNKGPKTPVLGDRIAVLTSESDLDIDPAVAASPMVLPDAVRNSEWAQSGGNAAKSMGQLELPATLNPAFRVSIGRGASPTARLAAAPIVANGRVYTIDTIGSVRASDASTGAAVWAVQTPIDKGGMVAAYGGGLAYDGGRVYATNGLGHVLALDASTGAVIWQVRPGGPLRGAPSVGGGALYVMSQDNQLYSLNTADGSTNWSASAALEIAGVFGSASPAIAQGTVVAGFSSGDLNAYRYENGRQVWQDSLQRTSISTSVSTISDIDADPVIDNGQVFAVGQGGRIVALDILTGQRAWEANIAGISTPWIAGDWLFVVTDDARLVCFNRQTGHVRWINQLPGFMKMKKKAGQISYEGPVLGSGRLYVVGTNGALITVDAQTGAYVGQTAVGAPVSVPPVIANGTLYVLDDKGELHAYR